MRTTQILLLLAFITFVATKTTPSQPLEISSLRALWSSWKTMHNKVYDAAQEATRFAIFVENYKKITQHNKENKDVKLGLNKFGDLTAQEFKNLYSGKLTQDSNKPEKKNQTGRALSMTSSGNLRYPETIDWRQKGAVTPVKDQKGCRASWAFAAVASLESFYFITSGRLLTFSEQQVIDCVTEDGGCHGGFTEKTFKYTSKAGIEVELDYPYTAGSADECKYNASKALKVHTAYYYIEPNSVFHLKTYLARLPVTLAVKVAEIFQFYKSGVIKADCGSTNINHNVLAVGYIKVDGEEAYVVKNSWGTGWGVDGYAYISTDGRANQGDGVCGVLVHPIIPKIWV